MTGMAVLAAGLIGCGGGGGDPNIPTASNPPITAPLANPLTITTGAPANPTNQKIAAAAFQAVDGGGLLITGSASGASGTFSLSATPAVSETTRLTIAEIVRRHAEKIKDHKGSASVTGAQIVNTIPCSVSGTYTIVFDDASGNASEIWVNCNDGAVIAHGTISSTNISGEFEPGLNAGSLYTISVGATITIDLSITSAFDQTKILISQGSFSFDVIFSGIMVIEPSGLEPGDITHIKTHFFGTSLLGSDGVNSEKLSDFNLTVDYNVAGTTIVDTTVNSQYTYANSASVINGAVMVKTPTPLHYPSTASRPDAGVIEITSSASPGKIKVTVLAAGAGVRVDVYAIATDEASLTNTFTLTWAQVEASI
jgi:hypothetical protein